LETPLSAAKSKMCDDHTHRFAIKVEVRVNGAARFSAAIGEIDFVHRKDLATR